MSPRQLRRLFHQHIGVSPKKFARIVRSQYFLNALKSKYSMDSLYDAYFDQAHFIKEIKEMTGLTPRQLMEKFKSLQ
ncbi:MAG: helix-turn-helix domain-containing protein [Chitinophagales bacterium]